MKLIKYASIVTLLGTLVGCGHGYEGEYELKTGSSNEFINAIAGAVGGQQLVVIGSDYIESNGQRMEYDDIFVRESGETNYLVFEVEESEETWKIIDENTLLQGAGLMSVKLEKIN